MRLTLLLSMTFATALPLGLVGCGDETSSGSSGSDTCFDYASFKADSPVVSFKSDVLPIFGASCGLSASCHGSQSAPVTQPFLGPPGDGTSVTEEEIKAIFAANVNSESLKAPGMKIIAPSDAANSFLMHKIDNTFACDVVTCEGAKCGTSMPQASGTLRQDKRDTIRRWIQQGAKND